MSIFSDKIDRLAQAIEFFFTAIVYFYDEMHLYEQANEFLFCG